MRRGEQERHTWAVKDEDEDEDEMLLWLERTRCCCYSLAFRRCRFTQREITFPMVAPTPREIMKKMFMVMATSISIVAPW